MPRQWKFSTTMDERGTLSVSPLCHDFEVSNEGATRQNISGSDSTSLANAALVPKPSVYVGGQPDPVAPIQGHTVIPKRPGASTSAPKSISTCGLEDLRKRDLDPGYFRTSCQAAGNTFLEERHNHRLQEQLETVV